MKNILITCLFLLCSVSVSAHDFEADGFYYNILDESSVEIARYGTMHLQPVYKGDIVIPEYVEYEDKIYNVVGVGFYAFWGCEITSLRIHANVNNLKSDGAFIGCNKLESIVIDENNPWYDSREGCNAIIETATNTLIAGCKNTIIPQSITAIGPRAFENVETLTSIVFPENITDVASRAFSGCTGLTSVTYNCEKVWGWIYMRVVETIVLGRNVKSVEDGTFSSCSNLKSIVVDCDTIGPWFSNNTTLQTVVFGENVKSIGDGAFQGCVGLTSVEIPSSVLCIGDGAFSGCSGLCSVTIPNGVTELGCESFYD